MPIVNWQQPRQVRSPKEHADYFKSDTNIAGTYVPNMSEEDRLRWKGKKIGGADPRVELRKGYRGALVLVVVRPTTLRVSMNGTAVMSIDDWITFMGAVNEAQAELLRR